MQRVRQRLNYVESPERTSDFVSDVLVGHSLQQALACQYRVSLYKSAKMLRTKKSPRRAAEAKTNRLQVPKIKCAEECAKLARLKKPLNAKSFRKASGTLIAGITRGFHERVAKAAWLRSRDMIEQRSA
jgi:hypothetical protein